MCLLVVGVVRGGDQEKCERTHFWRAGIQAFNFGVAGCIEGLLSPQATEIAWNIDTLAHSISPLTVYTVLNIASS